MELKYGFSQSPTQLYWDDIPLCNLFKVEYSYDKNDVYAITNIRIFNKNFDTNIPLDFLRYNDPLLYKEYLEPNINIIAPNLQKGKIRDFILFNRYIDDKARQKHNNMVSLMKGKK